MFKQRRCSAAAAVLAVFLLIVSSAAARQHVHVASSHAVRSAHAHHVAVVRTGHKPPAAVGPSTLVTEAQSATVLLGDRTLEARNDSLAPGQAEAFRFRAVTSGLAGKLHVYLGSGSGAAGVLVGLYSDTRGHPGSLLSTGSASFSYPGGWSSVSIGQARLVSGGAYWLALLGRGGVLRFRDRGNGSCASETSAQSTLGVLPGAWRTGAPHLDCPVSAYATAEDAPAQVSPIEPVAPSAPLQTSPPAAPQGAAEAVVPPASTPPSVEPAADPRQPNPRQWNPRQWNRPRSRRLKRSRRRASAARPRWDRRSLQAAAHGRAARRPTPTSGRPATPQAKAARTSQAPAPRLTPSSKATLVMHCE